MLCEKWKCISVPSCRLYTHHTESELTFENKKKITNKNRISNEMLVNDHSQNEMKRK